MKPSPETWEKIGATYLGIAAVLAPIWLGLWIFDHRLLRQEWETNDRLYERMNYLFDGANNAGLLDICQKDGVDGVWFKDDCDK